MGYSPERCDPLAFALEHIGAEGEDTLLIRVRAAVAALAVIALAGLLAVPAQAEVGDIVTETGTVTDASGAPMTVLDLVARSDSGARPVSTGDDGVLNVAATFADGQ